MISKSRSVMPAYIKCPRRFVTSGKAENGKVVPIPSARQLLYFTPFDRAGAAVAGSTNGSSPVTAQKSRAGPRG